MESQTPLGIVGTDGRSIEAVAWHDAGVMDERAKGIVALGIDDELRLAPRSDGSDAYAEPTTTVAANWTSS
jgi:hypothetical protein